VKIAMWLKAKNNANQEQKEGSQAPGERMYIYIGSIKEKDASGS
jgi:hypothetical protein